MDLVLVGKVLKPQGIKGELKVNSASFNIFKKGLKTYIDSKEYIIDGVKPLKDGIIIKYDLINSIEEAEHFRNKLIYVERVNITLNKDEYLADDVVGLKVVSDSHEFGKIDSIVNYGAQDIYYVIGEKNFSFPAIQSVILKFDIKNGQLIVDENKLKEVALYED